MNRPLKYISVYRYIKSLFFHTLDALMLTYKLLYLLINGSNVIYKLYNNGVYIYMLLNITKWLTEP